MPRRREKLRKYRGFSHQAAPISIGSGNGEGGIRTLGDLATTPVFETGSDSPQPPIASATSDDSRENLASCLALLAKQSPDLALLVEAWDTLPDAVRAGIVAMVKAASPRKEDANSKEAP